MVDRPAIDRSLSLRAQEALLYLFDTVESIEAIFEDIYTLEIMGKPQGHTGGHLDYTDIPRPVEDEVIQKSDIWDMQKITVAELKRIRGEVLGLRRAIKRVTQDG